MHDDPIAVARREVDKARRIVALTGAGISTESGIPDFRGPQGVWTRNPGGQKQSTLAELPGRPRGAARRLAGAPGPQEPGRAAPNAGHRALVALERRGTLHALVTQNIDELHQQAGHAGGARDRGARQHAPRRLLGLRRGARRCRTALARVRAGEDDPCCERCGGILKSDTISFGQALVPEVIDAALRAAQECDLLLAIGTTLQVQPVASMVPIAARAGAKVLIVNDQPTAMDELADVVLRGPIGTLLPQICGSA